MALRPGATVIDKPFVEDLLAAAVRTRNTTNRSVHDPIRPTRTNPKTSDDAFATLSDTARGLVRVHRRREWKRGEGRQ